MALTWIDNSAYAQSNFERPEILVSHPDEPLGSIWITKKFVRGMSMHYSFKDFSNVLHMIPKH